MLLANRKYTRIDNLIHIFSDSIIDNDSIIKINLFEQAGERRVWLTHYFQKINELYRFNNNDVFIFHDVLSANVFNKIFSWDNTVLVYHQQGTLYREWEFFTGEKDANKKKVDDELLVSTFLNMKYLAFPSKGAIDSLVDDDKRIYEAVNQSHIRILYNGFDNPGNLNSSGEIATKIVELINKANVMTFITVAALNEAKGVERIPQFLGEYKKKYGNFLWIVIGSGIKGEELEINIEQYGIAENTIWVKDWMHHDDILSLFQYTDFYILAHRASIFDFSTIEAMSYGNIPLLTPVGGNKEVIIDNNGIFLNDLSTVKDLEAFLNAFDLKEVMQKNIKIAKTFFSEDAFLNSYVRLINEMVM